MAKRKLILPQTTEVSQVETKDTGTIGEFSPWVGWFPTFGMGLGFSETGTKINPITALSLPVFNAAIRRISSDIAGLNILVQRYDTRDGWQTDPRHPIARLLRTPNHRHTRFDFIEQLITGYLLAGDGISAIVFERNTAKSNAGRPIGLIPIVPISVNIREAPNGALYYNVNSKLLVDQETSIAKQRGQTRKLVANEVLHIRNMSLDGGIHGTSPITLAAESIGLALAAITHAARDYKQGVSFRGMIVMPSNVKPGDIAVQNTQAQFQSQQAGLLNSGKTPVLSGGASYLKTSMTPAEAQLIEARDFQNAEIARLMNVPPTLLGIKGDTAYADYEMETISYVDKAILPVVEKIQLELERKLLFDSEQDDYRIRFDLTSLLRGDTAARYASYQTGLLNGFLNADQVADREGLPRPPDGDIYHVMSNTGTTGTTEPLPVNQIRPTDEPNEDQ